MTMTMQVDTSKVCDDCIMKIVANYNFAMMIVIVMMIVMMIMMIMVIIMNDNDNASRY